MSGELTLVRSLPVEVSTEPVLAWRTWALTGRRDATRLRMRPVAERSRPWPPGTRAEARCGLGRWHEAPDPSCSCGLHGVRDHSILRRTRPPSVLGRVALWGRVIEHELGYRARFAYPQRVRLVCRYCFWQWGIAGDAPSIVGWYPRDELVPVCDAHLRLATRSGMAPRRLLDVGTVEQRLREAYAIEGLSV